MPRKASGVEKLATVRETRKNGDIYIYERKTIYDPIKKYNCTISKTLVGKIIKGTDEIVETRPKRRQAKELPIETEDITAVKRHVGMLEIVNHVADKSGVTEDVMRAVHGDRGTGLKMLTLAWYAFATDGETWPGIYSWSVKYAGLLPYRDTPVSQDMYHDLFVYLGANEGIRQSIFKRRAEAMGQGELIALDSTTIATESRNLENGRSSIHKDTLIKNVYKVVEIYSVTSRQPIAYARIPGNIPDGSTVQNALSQMKVLHLDNVEIVTDSGYSAEENMLRMIKGGFRFIVHVAADTKWISPLIREHREELLNCGGIIHCDPKFSGMTVPLTHEFEYGRKRASAKSGLEKGDIERISKRLYIHIYYNSRKKADEDIRFRERFDSIRTDLLSGAYMSVDDRRFAEQFMVIRRWGDRIMEVRINHKAYEKHSRYHGFLVLVSNKERDTDRALEKYRSREYIEEDFKNSKHHVGGNHPRVWNDDTLDGQMLVQFLAQSMHESFETMLRIQKETLGIPNGDAEHDHTENLKLENNLKNWIRKTSMHNILRWYDAIEQTDVNGAVHKKWRTEDTKRDRLFIEKLGIQPRG